MLAVFKTGGKQYSVKTGQILKVEKLDGNKGDSISFDNVLAVIEKSNHTIGSPLIEGASVPVSYTHLRAHETPEHLVCRLLLEKKNTKFTEQYGR